MSTSARKAYHHGDLRRALITGARAMLAEAGPAGVTLRAVAARAGVSPAAPYRHFADKQALLATVCAEGFDELAEAVRDIEGGGLAALHQTGYAYIEFAVANQALYRLMFGSEIADPHSHPELMAAEGRMRGAFESALANAREAGDIADLDLADVAATMSALGHGLAQQICDGRLPPAPAREHIARVMKIVDHGLLPRG